MVSFLGLFVRIFWFVLIRFNTIIFLYWCARGFSNFNLSFLSAVFMTGRFSFGIWPYLLFCLFHFDLVCFLNASDNYLLLYWLLIGRAVCLRPSPPADADGRPRVTAKKEWLKHSQSIALAWSNNLLRVAQSDQALSTYFLNIAQTCPLSTGKYRRAS